MGWTDGRMGLERRVSIDGYMRLDKVQGVSPFTQFRLPRIIKQEVLGRTNRLLSLIRHGHWKRRAQQFFYSCVCTHYRGNVSTEPLPSNDGGNFTEPLPINDRGIHRQKKYARTYAHKHRQQRDLTSLLYFFQNMQSRLKTNPRETVKW
jgi:hypothetical protein